MTQANYFGGRYVGCDTSTGLGLPDWEKLFAAYNVPVAHVGPGFTRDKRFVELLNTGGLRCLSGGDRPGTGHFFPKITSRVTASGSMGSIRSSICPRHLRAAICSSR